MKPANWFALFFRWHQHLGIALGIAMIAWGLSGFAQPIFSRLAPQPVQFGPPPSNFQLKTLADIHPLLIR